MREFLKMTKEEWKAKYCFLGFVDYCPECGKEATSKHELSNGTTTVCACADCSVYWKHRWRVLVQ